jgi:hypothetical protein
MSPSNQPTPSSRAPAGLPPSGNTKYIAIAALLVAGTIAVILLKTCGNAPPPVAGPVRPASTYDAAPISHEEDNIPLPPPLETAVADSGPGVRLTTTFDPCAVKSCSGTVTSELETQVAYRAKQAHRCYDTALAQDSTLKGHVTLKVRIGSNGSVCAAAVTGNDMGVDSVANCVAQTFRASRSFPPPKGNCAEMNVPISFVPGGH